MARRVPTTDFIAKSVGPKSFYLVDTSVGRGADNKRIADIQLVKLFLRAFFSLNPALFKKLPKPGGRNASVIPLDGEVDGQTISGITVFQQEVVRNGNGNGLIVDGRVSVPTGLKVAGTKHVFTIFQLNAFFFNSNEENQSFDGNLENHPNVKFSLKELAAELSLQKLLGTLRS